MDCFICGGPLPEEEGPDSKDSNNEALISQGSLVIFLLTHLLDIPSKELETLLVECGDPFTWTSVCDHCSVTLVGKGRDLIAKMGTLRKELSLIKGQIKTFLLVKIEEEEFAISPKTKDKKDFRKRIRNLLKTPIFQEEEESHHEEILGNLISDQEDDQTVEEFNLIPDYHDPINLIDEGKLRSESSEEEEDDTLDKHWKCKWEEKTSSPQTFASPLKDGSNYEEINNEGDSDNTWEELISPRNKKKKMGSFGSRRTDFQKNFKDSHETFHSTTKLFICDICGMEFATKLVKDRHSKACSKGATATTKRVKKRIRSKRNYNSDYSEEEDSDISITKTRKSTKPHKGRLRNVTQEVTDSSEITTSEDGRLNVVNDQLYRKPICPEFAPNSDSEGNEDKFFQDSTLEKPMKQKQIRKIVKKRSVARKTEPPPLNSNPPSFKTLQEVLENSQIIIPEDGNLKKEDEENLASLSKQCCISDFPCPKCSKVMETFLSWRNHLGHCYGTVSGHVCPHCELPLGSLHILNNHIFSSHFNKEDLKCRGCDKIFLPSTSPSFKEHIASLSKKDPTNLCVISSIKCVEEKCSFPFPTQKAYETHMLIRHPKDIRKPFRCSLCPASFGQINSLRIHNKKHKIKESGKKDFMCEECGNTFADKCGLNNHRTRVHPKEKPFVCDKCGEAFVIPSKLKLHLRQKHER